MSYRTEEALGELLKEIQQHAATVRFDAMANIVAVHCQSEGDIHYNYGCTVFLFPFESQLFIITLLCV